MKVKKVPVVPTSVGGAAVCCDASRGVAVRGLRLGLTIALIDAGFFIAG